MSAVVEIGPALTIAERVLVLEKLTEELALRTLDHEKRVRWIERTVFYAMGVAGLASFLWNVAHR